ncbi:hypothetical protein CYMTET_48147 [Cymbomonas tetramitiformis]|uniref:procollagen-proline 4-dioxygenase n=1 Tax=Cymbomonas tetramitiformis TaxID=36881 RepID=A0AAE0BSU2_9CHLO|nr:hypothetical protein CYMTET_48147 [Cymbomonas tetramitiformis]
MPPATRTRRGGISLATVATAGFILFITFLVLGLAVPSLDSEKDVASVRPSQHVPATSQNGLQNTNTVQEVKPQVSGDIPASGRLDAGRLNQKPRTRSPRPRTRSRWILNAISQVLKAAKPSVLPSTPDILEPSRIIILSQDKPRAWLYRGLLTPEECDHIIDKAQPRMHRSGVVDMKTGGSTFDDIRTSTGTFLSRKQDAVIANVESKLAAWTMIPPENGEGLQVLRYDHGQEYRPHYDYFFHDQGKKNNRIATVLMYLTDVEEGGETVFPRRTKPDWQGSEPWSECGGKGLAVKPRKGDALLFFSLKPGGELDRGSNHAGCPVIRGVKWSATKWLHVLPLHQSGGGVRGVEEGLRACAWLHVLPLHQSGGHVVYEEPKRKPKPGSTCLDKADQCEFWAEEGEYVTRRREEHF